MMPPEDGGIASLYQDLIIEHYKRPRNRGTLSAPDAAVQLSNPTCGDEVTLHLSVRDGIVSDVKFEGVGCSISQASLSMMSQVVKGRTRDEIAAVAERFNEMLRGDVSAAKDKRLGDLRALAGVSRYPVRVRCALLGWDALSEALRKTAETNTSNKARES
jgi:nitrogen fixation protein NifU and related proteins